ncbi:NusG domain II-containing protein [Clostridiaceae bacterium 35-E11]
MTGWDKVLIILILIVSIAGIVFVTVAGANMDQKYIVIRVNNAIVKKISIEKDSQNKIYDFQFNHHTGYVEVNDGAVRMVKMDKNICPRSICSDTGWIDKKYQSIVCLPNKIMVTFEENSEEGLDIISY